MSKTISVKYLVHAALFTALLIVGAKLNYPLTPQIPIVLTNFFVVLAATVIGPWWGLASVALYLVLGLVGLPVFSSTVGLAAFEGPRGGYLLGYLLSVVVAGLVAGGASRLEDQPVVYWSRLVFGAFLGFVVIYIPGLIWFAVYNKIDLGTAITTAMVPFIIPDLLKFLFVVLLATTLRRGIK